MKIEIIAEERQDISRLVRAVTWSGSRINVARKLEVDFTQDDRDPQCPAINFDNGYTVIATDENGNAFFEGNIYRYKRSRAESNVHFMCFDHLHVMKASKMTKEYKDALPEDITLEMCQQLGVIPGNIIATGIPVSFIANNKTGYQIIMMAYTEANKKNEKLYQPIMNGAKLDIVEKGTLIEDFVLDSRSNMINSEYEESIEKLINQVALVDEQGNIISYEKQDDSIEKYSMFQTVLKTDPNKDMKKEVEAIFKNNKVERSGYVTALGDYRAVSSYSIQVTDGLFNGQFWIKQDTHTFKEGQHEMKLELEFENEMNKEEVPQKKEEKKKSDKRKRKK
ncbi:MAG: hypothetical protein IJ563_10460 [Selenomonadaceae bacterium]|nr:hypothetical protein [Selenomonadaceae bacterium]